jgi:hypothetical protein
MRSILHVVRYVVFIAFLAIATVFAADPIDWKSLPAGGLYVSLTTSGYRFREAGSEAVFPGLNPKTSFVASVALSNRGRSPVSFKFNDAGPRWTFRILDSNDQEIWKSNDDIVAPQVITEDILNPGKTWKSSVRIPLVVDACRSFPACTPCKRS